MSTRPNILFLMSDEHRPDVTGYEGDSIIRTPTLDQLADSGVVFRNAYAPAPICIPGRQAMMSGQLPSTCNCLRFGEDLAPNSMTFARRLSQYAYATVAAGKLHHLGADQMQGWTCRIAPDAHVSPRYIDGYARANREKPSSIDSKQAILRNYLIPAFGDKPLDGVLRQNVDGRQ